MTISENQLRKALNNCEFILHYQPKLDLLSGQLKGVEALIRWDHPERGLIPPLEFIPLAEATGLIIPIGKWAIRQACQQFLTWRNEGLPPLLIAVNLSGAQLEHPSLIQDIERILSETGMPPEWLELEITESMMIEINQVLPVVKALKQIGVRISLDDFGTGYSSLYHLKEFPIDILKIDQSFIQNCSRDEKDATIVKTIIAMAHQLRIKVLAEGIETKEHLIFLQEQLCDSGQGYFFSKPIRPEEFSRSFNEFEQILQKNGFSSEFTREKWLEQELEKTRLELSEVLRKQQGMTFKFVKKDGRFIHTLCDGELLHRMGFNSEQVVGRQLKELFPLDVANRKEHCYARAWNGEMNVNYEGCINGIWYLASLQPIRSGGQVVAVIGSCVDITERKASEERAHKIVEYSPRGVLIHQDGTILYANPASIRLLKENELVGKSIYSFILPNYHEATKQKIAQAKVGIELPVAEMELKQKDNACIKVETGSVMVPYNSGMAILTIFSDITDRKRNEEALRRSEKLSVVGQLAAGVAHEIRNPLTSIKGFIQLLRREMDHACYYDVILTEISRLEEIVSSFLSFSKPKEPKLTKLDPVALLHNVLTLIRIQANMDSIDIIEEFSFDTLPIYGDPNQLKQVLINILQNALDAMPNGGTIKVSVLRDDVNNSITYRIVDQGNGISENRIKHIGEPFFSTKEKGTGLGLMISQRIIDEHGGKLTITSKERQGTTVDISLPFGG